MGMGPVPHADDPLAVAPRVHIRGVEHLEPVADGAVDEGEAFVVGEAQSGTGGDGDAADVAGAEHERAELLAAVLFCTCDPGHRVRGSQAKSG